MTRRLNVLHINAVIETINNDTIERVSISPAKKPKGAYNITYHVLEPGVTMVSNTQSNSKPSSKIRLMTALQEIRSALDDGRIQDVSLEYVRSEGKFSYQLIQK